MNELAMCVSNDNKNVTPIETIDAIEKAGFKNVFVQWYDKDWEISQKEQVDYVKSKKLNIIFAHLGYQNINDIWLPDDAGDELVVRYQRNIKECAENGIFLVVMHLCGKLNPPIYNELGITRIQKIADYAEEIGVKIAFENTRTRGYLEYVLDNISNGNVGICFDSGHYHVHFNDEFDFERFKDKIFAVHLHDNDKSDDLHLMPFEGTLNWDAVLENLKFSDYNGPLTLELCYRFDYLNMSVNEFYKKGMEVGKRLQKMAKKEDLILFYSLYEIL